MSHPSRGLTPHGWRLRLSVAVVLVGLISLTALAATGWYASSDLLTPNHDSGPFPVQVHAVTASTIELDATPDSRRDGTFGIEWPDGHAVVGTVLATGGGTVTRQLLRSTSAPRVGVGVRVRAAVFWGDPLTALGQNFQNVSIPSELGLLPAWFIPGRAATMAVVVHGRNATRLEGLRLVPDLVALGLGVLLITYRNDAGAPASSDHLLHLGDSEWRDCEAAIRWAAQHGYGRFVLIGFSMGGAIAQMFMRRSSLSAQVVAVVLDSPVLDWDAVLKYQIVMLRGLPGVIVNATEVAIQVRIGFVATSYDEIRDASSLHVPTLLFEDGQDDSAPADRGADLHARSVLVEYHFFPTAGHTSEWNVAPAAYDSILDAFIRRTSTAG